MLIKAKNIVMSTAKRCARDGLARRAEKAKGANQCRGDDQAKPTKKRKVDGAKDKNEVIINVDKEDARGEATNIVMLATMQCAVI